MSFALTTDQVLDQSKDVTRRLGWLMLKVGDLVQPVKKCMGLKPGEKIVKLGPPIRVAKLTREPLNAMLETVAYGLDEVRREGFEGHPEFFLPSRWVTMFCSTHKGCTPDTVVTRIQFTYEPRDAELEDEEPCGQTCPVCHGSGNDHMESFTPCSWCDGEGRVPE